VVKVKSPKDVTPKHKYLLVIFKTTTYHVEGDERSRTNPGHGYPAHDDKIDSTETHAFEDLIDLESELVKLYEEERTRNDLLVIDVARTSEPKASIKVEFK